MVTKEKLNELRNKYPPQTRLKLIKMDDIQAPASGTCGTVRYVDDMGQIQMRWDSGSSLALIPGVDEFCTC